MREVRHLEDDGELAVAAMATEPVCGPELYLRRRPFMIADLSGRELEHHLALPTMIEAPRTQLYTFDSPSIRGVEAIITQGNAIVTRYRAPEAHRVRDLATRDHTDFGSPDMGLRLQDERLLVDERAEVVLEGPHALISPEEAYNYGMWLLQVVPYVDCLQQREYGGRFLCFADAGWQPKFLDFMGLGDRVTIQRKGEAYRIQGRLSAFRHEHRNLALTARDREAFARLKRRPDVARRSLAHEAIFVSRRTRSVASPQYRALTNEDELLEALRRLGFHIIEPEYLSFAEQASLFSQARVVVGLGGAGMFNTVFCEPDTKVISIESSTTWIEAHANLFATAGVDYGIIFGKQDLSVMGPQKPWSLDVPAAIRAIGSVL